MCGGCDGGEVTAVPHAAECKNATFGRHTELMYQIRKESAVKHVRILQINARQCTRVSSVSDITAGAAVWTHGINLWP
jgi:hypothetical protein